MPSTNASQDTPSHNSTPEPSESTTSSTPQQSGEKTPASGPTKLNLQTRVSTMSIFQRSDSAPCASTQSAPQSGSTTPLFQPSGSNTPTPGSLTPTRASSTTPMLMMTLSDPGGSNTPTPQRSGSTTPTSQQKKQDFRCRWDRCDYISALTSADLAEHVSSAHAQKQVDKGVTKFLCLWEGCKVYNTPSSSRTWLMKHILDHCGDKPFRCVFSGCRLSFRTQGGLIRHVQSHLSEQPSQSQKTPRSKDESPGKVLKKKRMRGKRRLSIGINISGNILK